MAKLSEKRARALLAEHGIVIGGFPEHHHETPALPPQDESGADMAQPPVHPESLPESDSAPEGDLPELAFPDALTALGRVIDHLSAGGMSALDPVELSWALGIAAGTIHRLQAENELLRDVLQSAILVRDTVGPQARDPHRKGIG